MQTPMHLSILFLLTFASSPATADEAFEANFAKAQENALTEQGAAYDAALGSAFAGMADFQPKVEQCLKDNPGSHSVRGYFYFFSQKDFQVVFEPKNDFSFCLSLALASPSLPPPPSVPYLNPFTFEVQP